MALEDDQTIWRTVFCKDPSLFSTTTYPNAGTEHTVVQSDPTKLQCTTTPSAITAQKVIQSDASLLKMTNTPDGSTVQPINLEFGIKGVWPPEGSTRLNETGNVTGVAVDTFYTVPANRKLYIASSLLVSRESADVSSRLIAYVTQADDTLRYFFNWHYYDKAGQLATPTQHVPALEAVATDKVKIESLHANIDGRVFIYGWLEQV